MLPELIGALIPIHSVFSFLADLLSHNIFKSILLSELLSRLGLPPNILEFQIELKNTSHSSPISVMTVHNDDVW